ncbi:alpha-L-fucosidase [Novosphingobium piscinae]|uniref:alpha-L-fucosidase n=1 Tax=Novosphingobium piscinae TaxID=1507448 RepID=A0A7X1G001_9SPHN|nr:alpha-L-fucosidase [Novosphingobium piscinae]MBC2670116.1 alpha-L-fucosidase [Novosphingobium piscinae]
MTSWNRRGVLGASATATLLGLTRPARATISPDWTSLRSRWQVPGWFREARFGIWAHWSAQCVPEQGDWYGRLMYVEDHPHYAHHLRTWGHPADRGFLEIENLWKAENWDPAYLVRRYKAAGARYMVALACHHDNLDAFASRHHAWNVTRVGPRRDIVGTWERAVRAEGLRFGVSNHTSHAWHWWQTAYGYDTKGPRKGERYDAFRLRREDGAGTWWDGLDPQELYGGGHPAPPDGLASPQAMADWHATHGGRWLDHGPGPDFAFAAKWLLRQQDLVEQYRPDLVYFDDAGLPFGPLGLTALAHYYQQAEAWHGTADVVATAKLLTDYQQGALVEDVERGYSETLRARPWQACTCIGDWHYNRQRFIDKSYVPAEQVIRRLVDTVSKNGNLLLSIPLRGDGTIDAEEERVLDGITAWMAVHGDTMIHGSRPWRIYGEGPTRIAGGQFGESQAAHMTEQDVRFTTKGGAVFAALMAWPERPVRIAALGTAALGGAVIERATLLGGGTVTWRQDASGLTVTLPRKAGPRIVPVIRLEGRGLV